MNQCKVEVNHENIRALLGGTAVYGDEDAFLRELLANAVDACNTRAALAYSFGTEFLDLEEARALSSMRKPFHARIAIAYNSQTQRLSVEDNGIGMNADDLERYVAKIGSSYYTSEEFTDQQIGYEPISQFGVGMLSCFMVAKALLIESKKDEGVNTAWNVSDPKSLEPVTAKWLENEDIEYIHSSREESGTRVTLVLRSGYAQKITLQRLVRMVSRYMLWQPIPIEISVDSRRVLMQEANEIKENPFADIKGILSIPVMDDWMEGCIWIYNGAQAKMIGRSALYQQGFLVAAGDNQLNVKPDWLEHMTYHIHFRKKFLNLRMARDGVIDDEKKQEFREMIGSYITQYFWQNPQELNRYLSSGQEPVITDSESEMKLLCNAVSVDVFFKGKEIELPISTVIQGFEGKRVRIAFMSRRMHDYYRLNYFVDYKQVQKDIHLIVFEKNSAIFRQLLAPYGRSQRYVISEYPGIIYDEMIADFGTLKSVIGYRNSYHLRPERIGYEEIFCFVTNEQNGHLEVVLNDEHRLAKMLLPVWHHPKVSSMMAVIFENIKQRILNPRNTWNKIVDYGGAFVDEWDSKNVATVQAVHCLESDFIESLNEFIECRLRASDRLELGLMEFQFHRSDFISWWFMPRE